MIFTKRKSFEKIKTLLKGFNSIIIVGCGECATTCSSGGEKEVQELKHYLEKIGKLVKAAIVVDATCDLRLCRKVFNNISKDVLDIECVLSLACGSGSAVLSELLNKPVISGVDTLFLAKTERLGIFYQRCSLCGDCTLDLTLGVCVKTLCPKELMNGPCGGSVNGKCEVNKNKECIWEVVYRRLKEFDQLKRIEMFVKPKSYLAHSKKPLSHDEQI